MSSNSPNRQRLGDVLELVANRLPTELLRPEFPDLNRDHIRYLFLELAEHVRSCKEWKGSTASLERFQEVLELGASLYCDGASRGNPGPAGAGALILDQHNRAILELSRFLDSATNNEAEYHALIRGLQAAADFGIKRLQIFSDSELVVKQIRGEFRVRNPRLLPLFGQAVSRLKHFEQYAIVHIGREQNQQADQLANEAIDRGLRGGKREALRLAQRE